jgi:hypothetical protein
MQAQRRAGVPQPVHVEDAAARLDGPDVALVSLMDRRGDVLSGTPRRSRVSASVVRART